MQAARSIGFFELASRNVRRINTNAHKDRPFGSGFQSRHGGRRRAIHALLVPAKAWLPTFVGMTVMHRP
jgi:hypothetical protein